MGEGEEDGLGILGHVVVHGQVPGREVRVDVRDRVVLALTADQPGDLDEGMQGEQADQLRTDVPARADDGDADGTLAVQGS